jgi:ATP-dependent exoDNAse (exonuclease V) beta subunit
LAARIGLDDNGHDLALAPALGRLMTDEERVSATDPAGATERAAAIYRRLLARDDLRALVDSGRVVHEVDFSVRLPDASIVRGTIDCLVITPSSVVVVDVKPGVPQDEHRAQLAWYVDAARALFPTAEVGGCLIYTG